MGQGVSLAAIGTGSASIDVKELADLTYERSLSSARFMKCIRARHQHGLVVVKIAMRPPPDFKLTQYSKLIQRERELLADIPNALGYQRIIEGERCGYLVRQYLHSSLYDRMSTRPFLDDIEKKWLAYQLLCVLRDCHARNVYHGDIKTENTLVTSWNWLYLTDFSSSFKKTYLPEDNPADFSYFFDTSGRRTCYVAPERFLGIGDEDDGRGVTWAMDIFSAGCVIAELFVESPIFSLSQLFKYRKGEYDPAAYLSKIEDKDVRELVSHMIQIEPESRYSAEEYLNFWRRKAFPEYFYSFLHQYIRLITDSSSGRSSVMPETSNFGEADERIDRIYNDFDKISYFLGYDTYKEPQKPIRNLFPLQVDIPNNRHVASSQRRRPSDHGTLIFLSLIVSSIRNTARASARIKACDLLLAFAEQVNDEAKLDRILPYLVVLLDDPVDAVKVAALKSMTQLLALVQIVSPVNAYVFTEYIRPRLQNLIWRPGTQTSPVVRTTYAACLSSLAHASLKILDMLQALRAEGSISSLDPETENTGDAALVQQNLYDTAKSDLIDQFEIHTKALLTDPDPSVRRAFLGSVSSMCVFFGGARANDVVLSHLNTYLNDKDWQLKCAFFQTIVGVATYVGSAAFEDFILPLMLQALSDPEEFVVERVIRSFASMAELGLFQRSRTWEMIDVVGRFMVHPNIWIRESAVHFVSAATRYLSVADNYAIVLPLVRPYLTINTVEFSETMILDCLKKPLPRTVLDVASTWSQKVEKGLFWRPQDHRTFSFGTSDHTIPTISAKDLNVSSFKKVPKNDEDEQWVTRLRNMGMTGDDEIKLLAMREYILRTSTRKSKETEEGSLRLQNILRLADLEISLQTVFFDKDSYKGSGENVDEAPATGTHTITDALLEASTTSGLTKNLNDASTGQSQIKSNDKFLNRPVVLGGLRRQSSDTQSSISSSPAAKDALADVLSQSKDTIKPRRTLQEDTTSDTVSELASSIRSGQEQHKLKSKTSAIALLGRHNVQRVGAETGLSKPVVNGEMDGISLQGGNDSVPAILNEQRAVKAASRRVNHTYDGTDPNVLKLLDNLAAENYPVDQQDFGPFIMPIHRKALRKSDFSDTDRPWRPQGIHLATFGEHDGAINRIIPSPDHVFFLTISDDSSVKIWDTIRLKQNLIHRSRQTHKHAPGTSVKCATFVENTHTFISGATDGSIHAVKVDCTAYGDSMRYGRLITKRKYQLENNEYAQWLEHFSAETVSTLIVATNLSRLLAIDLRSMTKLYSLDIPLQYGTPTTFCLDKKRQWLLLGTERGVLCLFDLRFQLHIKAWTFPAGAPIHRLAVHPFKGRGRSFVMAGGTGHPDVTTWDLEKMECKEIFRASEAQSSGSTSATQTTAITATKDLIAACSPISLPLSALARLSSNSSSAAISPGSIPDAGTLVTPTAQPLSISSFALCSDNHFSTSHGTGTATTSGNQKSGFMLTAGPDRKLRFWDVNRPEASAVLAGLGSDEQQPRYTVQQASLGCTAVLEKSTAASMNAAGSDKGKNKSSDKLKREDGSSSKKESRVVSIAREQKALLRSHLDVVTDVVVLESSVSSGDVIEGERSALIVSADRMGVIRVFM